MTGAPTHSKTEDRTGLRWTEHEDRVLQFHWGSKTLPVLSTMLHRSRWAVHSRARTLKLGAASRGTWSLRRVARYSGFSENKVVQALSKLGIHGGWAINGAPQRHGRARHKQRALNDEHVDLIVQFMLDTPYIYTDAPGKQRTTSGVWGVGKKPAACVVCGRSDRPHEARGHCTTCYQRLFRKASTSANPAHRLKFGERVLTEEKVVEIRKRRYAGETMDKLALEFGVTRQAISQIVRGNVWKHVGGPIHPYTYNNVNRGRDGSVDERHATGAGGTDDLELRRLAGGLTGGEVREGTGPQPREGLGPVRTDQRVAPSRDEHPEEGDAER